VAHLTMRQAPSKYRAKRIEVDGIKFASKREAKRWGELCLLQRQGLIADLERQVPIILEGRDGPLLTPTGRKRRYVADFRYTDTRNGLTVWEDAKGFKTPEYLMKKSVLQAQGIKVLET
jgi:hypothetical protein